MEKTASNPAQGQSETGPDDISLVKRCQGGDLAAYELLVGRYRQRVFNVVYGIVHNVEDANDLCQETFVKAWRSLGRFKGESAFYTWLYRIATNLGIDHLRRRAKQESVSFDDAIKSEDDAEPEMMASKIALPSKETERTELRAAIEAAIAQLSPEHRAVIMLKEFEGLAYKEIAKVVGCSLGTVMSRLFYARQHLQKLLKDVR
jgi:RNA polymerase sigma-70 factor (ECF subfamily)